MLDVSSVRTYTYSMFLCMVSYKKASGSNLYDAKWFTIFQEYYLLERMKKELSDKCEEAWSRYIKLTELIGALQIDVAQKDEAAEIEKKTIELANDAASISRKPEINRPIKY